MFGLGMQEILILALLALGAAVVIVLVVRGNAAGGAGRDRTHGD
jgi:hypothetical protein